MRNGFLPSPQARWCTEYLKIKPFEEYVGDDAVLSYIAIRADEKSGRGTYRPGATYPVYPFVEDGIDLEGVGRILTDSGIGLPDYYRWRSRSGCYFCFFQRRIEWVGLLRNHPDLFQKAAEFEKSDETTGEMYTWNSRESLAELSEPARVQEILNANQAKARASSRPTALIDLFVEFQGSDASEGCLICHL